MKGFVRDDEDLLNESRFPAFKNKLLAYLTAAQSADTVAKTVDAAAEVSQSLESWYQAETAEQTGRVERLEALIRARSEFADTARPSLNQLFQGMDKALERRGLSANGTLHGAQAEARKPFIARLSALRVGEATHENILRALREGKQAAEYALAGACRSMGSWVSEEMDKAEAEFEARRVKAGLDPSALREQLRLWRTRTEFPRFQWVQEPVNSGMDLTSADVMEQANRAIQGSLEALGRQLGDYIAAWRMILIRQTAQDWKEPLPVAELTEELQSCRHKLSVLPMDYERNRRQVKEIQEKLCSDR